MKSTTPAIISLYYFTGLIIWPLIFRDQTPTYHFIYLFTSLPIAISIAFTTGTLNRSLTLAFITGCICITISAAANIYSNTVLATDVAKLWSLLLCIYIVNPKNLPTNIKLIVFYLVATFYAINILLSLLPSYYLETSTDGMKFIGVLHNANLNSYTWLLSAILIFTKINKHRRIIALIFLWFSFIYIFKTSLTRSLFASIPFLITISLNLNQRFNAKWLLYTTPWAIILAIGQTDLIENLWQRITGLTTDNSFRTRLSIYQHLITEIKLNHYLLPGGAGYSEVVISEINDNLPAHNDILQYYLDYGILFIPLLHLYAKRLLGKSSSITTASFALFTLSAALHNNIFSFFIVPLSVYIARLINEQDTSSEQEAITFNNHSHLQRGDPHRKSN